MSRYNDIERELERFEAEIEQLPLPAVAAVPPRPQQPSRAVPAFIPPQLRVRSVRPPPPPPPPPQPSMYAPRSAYPPQAMQAGFSATIPRQPAVRPNVVIAAAPVRYDANNKEINESATKPTPTPSAPSEALARAKAILESLKKPAETSSPAAAFSESAQVAHSAKVAGNGLNVPMPLNMPGAASSTAATSVTNKKSAKDKPSTSQEEEQFNGIRKAGGETWMDATMFEWDPNDHRLFCGDLGNETNDDTLAKVFSIYPSFQKAKVIRDKRTNKTRGYGFVSFKDAQDLARAIREMNGKYVGNRPIKLRKSTWQERNIGEVKKKEKMRKRLGLPY